MKLQGRWTALVIAVVVVAVMSVAGLAYAKTSGSQERALCAELADSAGLYVGNAVNIRGVKVGTVSSVSAEGDHVEIGMDIESRPLSSDLKVVAVNNSVLADRRLELVDAEARGGSELADDDCVDLADTFTPISVSAAFQTFTTMFDEIGGTGADSDAPIGDLLDAAGEQFEGTGDDINKTIRNLSGFMADPNEFLSQMRKIFDNLAVLTAIADDNWDSIRDIGKNSADLTELMGALFRDFVYIFEGLGEAGPGLDDLLGNVLPPVLDLSEAATPIIDVALSRVDDLKAIIENLPGIATGLSTSVNHRAEAFQITYRSPKVVAGTPNSSALCTLMNQSAPGSCDPRSPRAAAVDLSALVTSAVQGGIR
ncbi:MlaD family protein [Williamsia sp.]|uniref:MlaD family protein n=1 Tax=Williamsia sp. TaxID=1872085 RepID=UPI002F934670